MTTPRDPGVMAELERQVAAESGEQGRAATVARSAHDSSHVAAPVAALLFGGVLEKDAMVAAAAARIARDRGADLIGLQVSPRLPRGAIVAVGFDPEKLERAEMVNSRRAIREMFETLNFPRAPIVLIDRPPLAAAIRVVAELGAATLVISPLRSARWRLKPFRLPRSTVEVVVASPGR